MCTAPPSSFSFAEMLSEDFDTSKIFDDTLGTTSYLMPDSFLPPVPQQLEPSTNIIPPCQNTSNEWMSDFTSLDDKNITRKRKTITTIPKTEKNSNNSDNVSKTTCNDKKMDEKEKHKVRQRQRRQKMTNTMDLLKSMIPKCVEREKEASSGNKKKKVDQTQLLEMTVEYIQELKSALVEVQRENTILRSCIDKSPNSSDLSDSSQDISSPLESTGSPSSDVPFYYDTDSILGKRSLSQAFPDEYDIRPAKQPTFVRTARVLMAIFVIGLIIYNPVSFPSSSSSSITSNVPAIGRVLHSTGSVLSQSPAISTSWILYISLSVIVKWLTLMFWTFGAMLLDHVYYPPMNLVKQAKRENDIGVKLYDKGDYQGSRRHFEKAMTYLGRSPRPSIVARIFHLPLEMWRQVLHLLRIGLWCDGHLVHLRGGKEAMLELARSNHYLFSLNMLANNMDSHSVLYFLVSLNAAESLYQKPPVLAEVYATVAIAFYGLLGMRKAYKYLMGKAWNIVETVQEEKPNGSFDTSSLDKSKAYLLFLSSYGSLCKGNLDEVREQIQHGCDLFLKEGNKNMFFQGQFFISYTHFLKGNFFTAMQILKSIEVCNLGDPRVSWWRELLIICCKLSLKDDVTQRDVSVLENLYSKVESHSTFAPTLAAVQQSVLALLYLRLGNKERALSIAFETLEIFENCQFLGWIFYSGYYLSEVFFTIWEEEKENNIQLANQVSRMTHRLCSRLRKVAKECELSRPIALLVIGRYALNMKDYSGAIEYLEQAAEAAEDHDMETYKVSATWLVDRATFETNKQIEESFV